MKTSKLVKIVFVYALCGITLLNAQVKKEEKETQAEVIYPKSFHTTRPLSELVKEHPFVEPKRYEDEESEDRENRKPQHFVRGVKKGGIYANDENSMQTQMGNIPGKAPITNWAGQTATGFRPFDPSGAAGLTQYVQMINATTFKVYNKVTGAVTLTTTLGTLWSPATPNSGDPIVMYDKAADRWFLAQFGQTGNRIYIAVSTSGDATGSYNVWTYTSPQFPDYLKFSVWQDGYYMTSNQGTQKVFVFERSAMIAGTAGARSIYQTFTPPNAGFFFVPLPGDAADGTLPASGTPCPIFSYSDNGWGGTYADAINIYKVAVNWIPTTPTETISFADSVATAAFDGSYNASWNDVSQPGTSQKLDGIGGTLMYRAQWKPWNTNGYNSVVLSWGVKISGTQRSIKWCELRQNQTTGTWGMYQQGIYTPDADTRWMSSIAMDNNGSIGMAYLKSNATSIYPSLCYTGRRTCDALGTLPVTEVVAKAGSGSQTGTNRDGDYAQTVLDPVDGITFWHTGEYMGTGGNAGTQIFSFQITPCAATVPPVASFSGSPTTICAGGSVAFTDLSTNTPTSWSWSFPGGTPSTSTSQNPTVVYSTPGTYSVTLTSTNGAGSSTPVTTTNYITVNAVPATPAPSSNSPLCAGATLNLTAAAVTGATYAWTGPSAYTAGIQSPTRPSTTAAMAGTYSLTVTVAGCTSAAGTTAVVINALPTVTNATLTQTVCSGGTATFAPTSAVAGTTFAWTATSSAGTVTGFSASGTGNINNVLTNSGTTSGTVSYVITPTGPAPTNCVGTPSTFVVTVRPTPVVTVPANITVCASTSVAASAFTSTVTGSTYAWTNSNTAIGLAANGTGNVPTFTAANTTSAPITATVTVTPTANTCAGTPATYTITVNPTPTVTVPTSQTLCNGASTTAITFAGAVTGTTFAWTNNNTSTGLAASGTGNIASFIATNTGTTAITSAIVVTPSANGCTGSPQTFLITVSPAPSITNSPMTMTICSGDTANFNPTSDIAGAAFSWTAGTALPGITGITASGTGAISDVLFNSNPVPGFATYSISATAGACTGAASTLTVTINPVTVTPTITTAGMVLTSSAAAGNQWYLNGVAIAGATAQTYTATANGTYTVVVTESGCASAASAPVVITTVGIADNSIDNTVMIYPNPSSGVFTVELLGSKPQTTSVKVFDVLGQLIYQSEITSAKGIINLSAQANGIYFIQMKTATGLHTMKVMKQ